MKHLFCTALSVLFFLLLGSSEARSGTSRREALARKAFLQAEAAFARRDFASAAQGFERAAERVPHPSTWLNAAESWERAGDLVRAAVDCDRVLEMKGAPARFRAEATRRLVRIEGGLATLELHGTSPAGAQIDDGSRVLLPKRQRVLPGTHVVRAFPEERGEPRRFEVTVASGDVATIDLDAEEHQAPSRAELDGQPSVPGPVQGSSNAADLSAIAPPVEEVRLPTDIEGPAPDHAIPTADSSTGNEHPVEPDASSLESAPPTQTVLVEPSPALSLDAPPTSAWIAFSVAGAATIVAVVAGSLTLGAKKDFDSSPTPENADTFFDRRLTTNVFVTTAIVGAGTGVLLWLLGPDY